MSKNSKRKSCHSLVVDELVRQIFPLQCLRCSSSGANLCPSCLRSALSGKQFCLVCAKSNFLGNTCLACRPNRFANRLVVRFAYQKEVKKLIMMAKYEDYFSCLSELSKELAGILKDGLKSKDYVVCSIPLSPKRLRQRGFNQAEIIAKIVASELSLEYISPLKRKNQAASQVELQTKQARRKNIQGVFSVVDDTKVQNNIILVDDVVTTGATLLEASKVLRKICQGEIICAVLAH